MSTNDSQSTRDMIEDLIKVVSHPVFNKLLSELGSVEPSKRDAFLKANMSPAALAEKGVPVQQGLRVTTRYFEEPPTAESVTLKKIGEILPPIPEPAGEKTKTVCTTVGTTVPPFSVCVSEGSTVPAVIEG
jgi:hypothetical protein